MRVFYLTGNHETGLHYLMEGMPAEIPVGREHPWDEAMKQSMAMKISDQMQPYPPSHRWLSKFGRGYIDVAFRQEGREQRALVFHGDQLNHMVAIRLIWGPIRWLRRPWCPPLTTVPDVYESFELWVASQDEQTIGAAGQWFGNDLGALTRLASSFCGSRVMHELLAGDGAATGAAHGLLGRAWHALPYWGVQTYLWLLRIFASRMGVVLRWVSAIRLWPATVSVLAAFLLTLFLLGLSTWPGIKVIEKMRWPTHLQTLQSDLYAIMVIVFLASLVTIVVDAACLGCICFCRLKCRRPKDLRANLREVCEKHRWLPPMHSAYQDHARLPSPTFTDYHWCLVGHFHDPRMEQDETQRPRMVDVGSWRPSSLAHNTFATISFKGVQLWQYKKGGALLIGPPGSGAGATSKDGLWWIASERSS
jgi:hypothetical protein